MQNEENVKRLELFAKNQVMLNDGFNTQLNDLGIITKDFVTKYEKMNLDVGYLNKKADEQDARTEKLEEKVIYLDKHLKQIQTSPMTPRNVNKVKELKRRMGKKLWENGSFKGTTVDSLGKAHGHLTKCFRDEFNVKYIEQLSNKNLEEAKSFFQTITPNYDLITTPVATFQPFQKEVN